MLAIEIDASQLDRLAEASKAAGKNIAKEIAGALNQVAKKTKLEMGRRIRETINLKKAVVEKPLSVKSEATESSFVAVVSLKNEDRFGLQHFGARQDKRGVSYKISKTGGRKRVNGAFMGPRPGVLAPKLYGGVWKRMGAPRTMTKGRRIGKIAEPIVKLYGVSPWGAYVKNNMEAVDVEAVSKELAKQMERRIEFNVLRASGIIKS